MLITFSKSFYRVNAVKKAVKAYRDLAVFDVKETADEIKVKIKKIDQEVKQVLKDEFCNYVLAETKRLK